MPALCLALTQTPTLPAQAAHCLPFTLGGLEARVAAAAKGGKPSAEDTALLQAAEEGGLLPAAGPPGGAPVVDTQASLPERPQTVPAGMQRENVPPPLSTQLKNMQLREAGPNPVDKDVPQVSQRSCLASVAGVWLVCATRLGVWTHVR